jgi:hypothetical protein
MVIQKPETVPRPFRARVVRPHRRGQKRYQNDQGRQPPRLGSAGGKTTLRRYRYFLSARSAHDTIGLEFNIDIDISHLSLSVKFD